MKKSKLIFILNAIILTTTLTNAYAEDYSGVCEEKHDKLYCHAGQLNNLHYLGDAMLDGTTVTGATKIIGDLEIRHAQLNTIDILGDVHANDSTVNGEAVIKGDATLASIKFANTVKIVGDTESSNSEFDSDADLVGDINVSNANFKGSLLLASNKANMFNSQSRNIKFHPCQKPQNLYLNQNSYVNGEINFPSNNGTIYLSGGSQINGKVIGGKVVNN